MLAGNRIICDKLHLTPLHTAAQVRRVGPSTHPVQRRPHGAFAGAFPSTVHIPRGRHASAVRLYKRAFHARAAVGRSRGVAILDSSFGFRLRVETGAGCGSVRLALPPRANRAEVARALAAGGGVSHAAAGLVVRDPFGVTWTLA